MLQATESGTTSRPRTSPIVAWTGPSTFDGETVRAAVYALSGSKNRKTGPMVQVLFAPDAEAPHRSVKSGGDVAVCGDCLHRPANAGSCYVVTPLYLPAVWTATAGMKSDLHGACTAVRGSGMPLRIGSWGDPTSVPFEVIRALADAARVGGRCRHTSYTQRWRTCDEQFREIVMASVISPQEREDAKRLGWRTFRIRTADMPVLEGEIVCPATPEGGEKVTCAQCLLCNGAGSAKDIVVVAHGSKNKVRKLELLVQLRVTAFGSRAVAGGVS